MAGGSVLPLGLGALLRAICASCSTNRALQACLVHRDEDKINSGPQGIDVWNVDISIPRTFIHLTSALQDGSLNCLRLIQLCEVGLCDHHVSALACSLRHHPALEMLSVRSNRFTAVSGPKLFDCFVSLRNARVLDLSLNDLGDAMVEAMSGRIGCGEPWSLQAVWLAYCRISTAGITDMARIARAGAERLEHIVVSGVVVSNL